MFSFPAPQHPPMDPEFLGQLLGRFLPFKQSPYRLFLEFLVVFAATNDFTLFRTLSRAKFSTLGVRCFDGT